MIQRYIVDINIRGDPPDFNEQKLQELLDAYFNHQYAVTVRGVC